MRQSHQLQLQEEPIPASLKLRDAPSEQCYQTETSCWVTGFEGWVHLEEETVLYERPWVDFVVREGVA